MKKIKKICALGLICGMMITSLTACNKKNAKNEEISIGTWWLQYYDSSNTSLDDNEQYTKDMAAPEDTESDKAQKEDNRRAYELKFANVKKIEEKYGIKFFWDNITYSGVKESINTSILAGTPDEDIYLVEAGFGIPAQMNGLAVDLKKILPADSDIFTTQKNAGYLDLGDGKACIFYRIDGQGAVEGTYPLGFNMQLLAEYNLEDPRVLWEKGEWTWDKFLEYCKVLTKDTDNDGQIDQYGYCGYEAETLSELLMSNGAVIAGGPTQTLTSEPVGEVLTMMSDMYNVHKICYPYDYEGDPSSSMRNQYREGNIGFFPIAAWIMSGNNDFSADSQLPFDVAFVRWPVGPSGNKDTNCGKNGLTGEFYMIPAGVAQPDVCFNVINDFWNWYDGDLALRDSKNIMHWWYEVTAAEKDLQEKNFNVMKECGSKVVVELGTNGTPGFYFPLQDLMQGLITPAQMQEEYKQQLQDALDTYFGK